MPDRRAIALGIAAVLCGTAACGNRLPSAIRMPSPAPVEAPSDVVDLESALRTTLRGDPLARTPRLLEPELLRSLDLDVFADTVVEIRRLEEARADLGEGLDLWAARWPGTIAVPLARGYRLAIAERRLGEHAQDPRAGVLYSLGRLLLPVTPGDPSVRVARPALAALARDPGALPEAIRTATQRSVLAAWLVDPSLPLGPVDEALQTSTYDRLRGARIGRLVHARATGTASADPTSGRDALVHATRLALTQVAADRAAEQGAWADLRRAEADALGAEDPVEALLIRAFDAAEPAAGARAAAGTGWLAVEALRLTERCDLPPCIGLLDRTTALSSVAAYDPSLAPLARTWQVIALKDALDGLDAGRDTVRHADAVAALADALWGTGAGTLPEDALAAPEGTEATWAALSTAVGEPGATTWEDARLAIGAHLATRIRDVRDTVPADWRPLLDRIARRAVP